MSASGVSKVTSKYHATIPRAIRVPLQELKDAGLSVPCRIRLKLFTLDQRLIARKTGRLGPADHEALGRSMPMALPLWRGGRCAAS